MKGFKEVPKRQFEQLVSNIYLLGWDETDSPIPNEGNLLREWWVERKKRPPIIGRAMWVKENAIAYYDDIQNKYYIDEEL